ncbi:ABC transporter permease [Magnetovibrio sp.]|uniref:ABC transporter permease n=1 Tax=Magnetovibrio sp. TaxID=2024836 RepID=UPI002F93EF0F
MSTAQANLLSKHEARNARREMRRHKMVAFAMVTPLLAFIFFAFVAPIGTMLHRGFYNPVVAELIPQTLEQLSGWNGDDVPDDRVLNAMAIDLKRLAAERKSGKLAEEINRNKPGASSLIKSTARKMGRLDDAQLAETGAALLLKAHKGWADPALWRAVQKSGQTYTDSHYLTALDLERTFDGELQLREATQIYIQLYTKTLRMALIITVLCLLLGYPLAYYLANAPSKTANMLMIFVLLPFWTSLLVRTTAWIALLQTNGVINSFLTSLRLTAEPLEMLYTEFSTIIAMTHILLPFMILPLYSVMKGIDPSYMRAAMSMGARPIPAFLRVYLPNTLPGLSAGALLVFIISVGYYITPALVGGTDGQMISNIIAFHMQQSNNWGLAAALGTLLLVLILTLYWVYDRFVGASNIKLG